MDHNEDLLESIQCSIEIVEVHSFIDAGNTTRRTCPQATLVSLQILMPNLSGSIHLKLIPNESPLKGIMDSYKWFKNQLHQYKPQKQFAGNVLKLHEQTRKLQLCLWSGQ